MGKKKKIAIVANSTWNIFNFRLNLLRKLKQENYEVVVIAPVDEYILYLDKRYCDKHIPLTSLSRKSTNPIQDLALFWELYKIYLKEKPDLVLHYTIKPNIFGNLAAKLSLISSICIVTGLGYTFLNGGLVKSLVQFLYKFSFFFADRVMFENQDDKALFIKKRLASSKKCISVKGCGIDTLFFSPVKKEVGLEKVVFTFIGRLLYDKGIVEFVEAAKIVKKQHPSAEFWVIGELDIENPSTISREQLVEWIENKDIRYRGITSDIRTFIKDTDVVTLPSYREGLPKVVLEGMAMGKPIVTTNTAGCRETVIHGENGLLVPVKNYESLATAMNTMIEIGAQERAIMGQKSRERTLNEFADEHITRDYLNVIRTILSSPPSSKQPINEKEPVSKS